MIPTGVVPYISIDGLLEPQTGAIAGDALDTTAISGIYAISLNYALDESGNWRRVKAFIGDDEPILDTEGALFGVKALAYAWNQAAGEWEADFNVNHSGNDADGLIPQATADLSVPWGNSFGYAFNGATYDRIRIGSAANLSATTQPFAQMAVKPGNWTITHAPAANTVATATKAAGAAGVRHVCTAIHAKALDVSGTTFGATGLIIVVRDGATGAGTILWQSRLINTPAIESKDEITMNDLNIVGSPATAMTIEFQAQPGANNFELVNLSGYSI